MGDRKGKRSGALEGCQHVVIRVSSLEKARAFYVENLGLPIIEDNPDMDHFAVRAGNVRFSVFGGHGRGPAGEEVGKRTGVGIVLRSRDIEGTVKQLMGRGVRFEKGIETAPGFCRYAATRDPDGNVVEIAEYEKDPLDEG